MQVHGIPFLLEHLDLVLQSHLIGTDCRPDQVITVLSGVIHQRIPDHRALLVDISRALAGVIFGEQLLGHITVDHPGIVRLGQRIHSHRAFAGTGQADHDVSPAVSAHGTGIALTVPRSPLHELIQHLLPDLPSSGSRLRVVKGCVPNLRDLGQHPGPALELHVDGGPVVRITLLQLVYQLVQLHRIPGSSIGCFLPVLLPEPLMNIPQFSGVGIEVVESSAQIIQDTSLCARDNGTAENCVDLIVQHVRLRWGEIEDVQPPVRCCTGKKPPPPAGLRERRPFCTLVRGQGASQRAACIRMVRLPALPLAR